MMSARGTTAAALRRIRWCDDVGEYVYDAAEPSGGDSVDLDDDLSAIAGKPATAGADDGARVEGAPAGAKERHRESVAPPAASVEASGTAWVPPNLARYARALTDERTRRVIDQLRESNVARPMTTRAPSPGPCPTCGTQRRERGEVRTYLWRCGCPVRPESVYEQTIDRETLWVAVSHFDDAYWAHGASYSTIEAEHPTREGAVAAWREALANAQRQEDL